MAIQLAALGVAVAVATLGVSATTISHSLNVGYHSTRNPFLQLATREAQIRTCVFIKDDCFESQYTLRHLLAHEF
jgi:hypothetical protein